MLRISARSFAAFSLNRNRGFSLIEMAVVLLIVGLLLSGLFTALGDSSANRNRIQAASELENIEEALYGFAQTTGRLPCPATATSAGAEAPITGGNCTRAHGFVPARTLGLQGAISTNGLLLDPWGNPYRYSVSVLPAVGGRAFTSIAGMKSQFAAGAVVAAPELLCVAGTTGCSAPVYANSVPALVYSIGADYATYSSDLQVENLGGTTAGYPIAADNNFVNSGYAEEGDNAFDDILIWISPNVLFSRMVNAGRLP